MVEQVQSRRQLAPTRLRLTQSVRVNVHSQRSEKPSDLAAAGGGVALGDGCHQNPHADHRFVLTEIARRRPSPWMTFDSRSQREMVAARSGPFFAYDMFVSKNEAGDRPIDAIDSCG